ncbi:Vitamin B12 import ATP-binding protein BtuD [anaerobic digester metagenome]
MITFERLRKEYDGVAAVDDLSLEIPRGEVFGLLGPNGAGKTTTILMLVGLVQPTSGRCLVDGVDVALEPIAVKRRMGFMPDDVGFYENMTAEQNLEFFAALYDLPRSSRTERITAVLDRVNLAGLEKKVGGYSRGMVQRLGIAKVLLNDPDVLVLDEPTANLDPVCVAEYREIVRSLRAEGRTVVVSSHILPEVSKVCTSFAILVRGRLITTGSVSDLPVQLAQSAPVMAIRVETRAPLPELDHPAILASEFDDDRRRARLEVTGDIRDWLVDRLAATGVPIRGMAIEEPSLEEVFMRYYHAT